MTEGTTSTSDPLDRLPAQVNLVLTQIGRIFQQSLRSDVKTFGKTKNQAHEAMTKATRAFHEALDDIEIDLINAKPILERDLKILRDRREERERALRAEELQAAGQQASKSPEEPPADDAMISDVVKLESNPQFAEDTIMSDAQALPPELVGDSVEMDVAPDGAIAAVPASTVPTHEEPQSQGPSASAPPPPNEAKSSATGDLFATADFSQLGDPADFPSMFNEDGARHEARNGSVNAASTGASNTLNFDLDFPRTVGADDFNEISIAPDEGIESLLPGLESIVGVGSSTTNTIDQQDNSVEGASAVNPPGGQGGTDAQAEAQQHGDLQMLDIGQANTGNTGNGLDFISKVHQVVNTQHVNSTPTNPVDNNVSNDSKPSEPANLTLEDAAANQQGTTGTHTAHGDDSALNEGTTDGDDAFFNFDDFNFGGENVTNLTEFDDIFGSS